MNKTIYMDNAATTAVSEPVLKAMLPYLREQYGNPSSIYSVGRAAKEAVEKAREQVARVLNAQPKEIFFTSGGTESDNWAIKGIAQRLEKKGKHLITSAVEHHAVMHSMQALEKQGWSVTYLPVNEAGQISLEELENAIRADTVLISIMTANNEIGTILPVEQIGGIAKAHNVLFHTDAVQAVGHIPVDVEAIGADLLSLSAHKFHGPKGVGALYVRRGVSLPAYLDGGAQERGRRPGTENVPGIVGLGEAITQAAKHMGENADKVSALRDRLIEWILKIPYSHLNGSMERRLPGNASFVFECIEGESMLVLADMQGICASSGSACSSASLEPSYVLLAIGRPHEVAHGSVRFSLSEENTQEEVDRVIEVFPKIIERLRSMSPLWEEKIRKEGLAS